jgi:uncharacterized protein YndB with AHSA1/START domain
MKYDVRIERIYRHSPEHIWRALTERDALGAWFMSNDMEPTRGQMFTFRMKPQRGWDGVTYCEVTEVEPPHRIAYTYRGRASFEKTLACAAIHSERAVGRAAAVARRFGAGTKMKGLFTELDTVLRFTLERVAGGGTRLILEHMGFRGFKQTLAGFVMGLGWAKVLRRLPPVLDRLAISGA